MVPEKQNQTISVISQSVPNAIQNDEMRIAWRYNNLDKVDAEQGGGNQKNSYTFDLSQSVEDGSLDSLDVTLIGKDKNDEVHSKPDTIFHNPAYVSLIEKLQEKLSESTFEAVGGQSSPLSSSSSSTESKNLLRICIESFGSPLWYTEHFTEDICLFLTILKAAVRVSLSVCCITVPTHLFQYIVCKLKSNYRCFSMKIFFF